MLFNRKLHIVSHTHWDREWYFTTCDSLVLLDKTLSDILNELNANKHVNFTLDGQVSLLDDYLTLHPNKLENIRNLVKQKRLFIGPWYTQTDTQLVNGISIVSNLYYGIYRSKHLCHDYMKVGYLPDTFGFSNQLPMILNQFEINKAVIWRGANFNKQKIEPYFKWISQDNSSTTTAILHNGYGMAKGLNDSEAFINNKLISLVNEYKGLTNAKDILIPVGNDQNNIVLNLDKVCQNISSDLKISNYENFMDAIKDQITTSYLGEFRETAYTRVHKSCGAIRFDIKNSNYLAEIELIKGIEPLNVMAKEEGFGLSTNLIQEAWKLLFQGQAHDGIVGCVSDDVAIDIVNRNKKSLEISKSMQNYIKKSFANAMNLQDDELLIFNLEANAFKGYKEVTVISHHEMIKLDGVISQSLIKTKKQQGYHHALVETPAGNYYEKEANYFIHTLLVELQLPSFGYKTFKIINGLVTRSNENVGNTITNDKYCITINNNQLELKYDNKVIKDFISLYDCANDGDTYDFSPLINDQELKLNIKSYKTIINENVSKLRLDCTTSLPLDLVARKSEKKLIECPCCLEVSLRNDNLIYVDITFDNKVLSHRLRVRFKSFKSSNKTIAATPFGSITRAVLNGKIDPNWMNDNVEYPIDIETNSGFVAFKDNDEQLVVFNKGSKEYQAINDSIYMTLFSSCDELGKPDLLYRPGRASGDVTKKGHIRIDTPLAQVLGSNTYQFAVSFMSNDDYNYYQVLNKFEGLSIYYQKQDINLFFERIDNKIQLLPNDKVILKEQSYFKLDGKIQNFGIYNSLYDNKLHARVMAFDDIEKQELKCSNDFIISNLLEQGDDNVIKGYRLYTIRRNRNENK